MMDTEEKAKAYDKAIKKLHEIITMDNHPVSPKEIGEFLFPGLIELKSEDERMIEMIIDCLNRAVDVKYISLADRGKCLAYLEKQKEQKPLSVEETELNSIAFLEQLGYTCIPPGAEQKPAEWSEDYREEDLRMRFAFYTYKNEEDDGVLYLSNVFVEEASRNKGFGTKILAAAEKVAETLGAIQIRLKVKQNSPANAWYRKHGYGYMTFEDGYDWLEKTLEYMKPIKQEWSEEDEIHKLHTIQLIEDVKEWSEKDGLHHFLVARSMESISWLKSLRPQPQWKPSEEQIKALQMVKDSHFFMYQKDRVAIEKLLEQLKSL